MKGQRKWKQRVEKLHEPADFGENLAAPTTYLNLASLGKGYFGVSSTGSYNVCTHHGYFGFYKEVDLAIYVTVTRAALIFPPKIRDKDHTL